MAYSGGESSSATTPTAPAVDSRNSSEDLDESGTGLAPKFVWISLPFEWFGRVGRLFMSYGTIPSKEQLQACGGQCPICHDNFNSPVLLECNHIFCELCVGTWFDREQTCPLCRAKIVDDPSYRDGATTFFLQLY
nr:E3 ubiquitin-protein ligase RNFT1-like [Aedes albopictus]